MKQTNEEITGMVLETAKDLENVLNTELLIYFAKAHNIPLDQNRFLLKQEIVARGAYFLNVKKKYCLFITNEEHVELTKPKVDSKGMITRRSDYPSITKERVQQILDMLVASETVDYAKIKKFIDETEKELLILCRNGQKEIARPVTFSKDEESYKKAPPQIAGMKFWNLCEYAVFVPGTKGYLFKIKGIDYEKSPERIRKLQGQLESHKMQYIVVPTEEPRLPEYYIIDVDAMLKFAWIDRISELLEPISPHIWHKQDPNAGNFSF